MGYLSQKKKKTNTREFLNLLLGAIGVCCFIVLFFDSLRISEQLSHWLFQIYVCALVFFIYSFVSKFYWQGFGLLLCALVLFFKIGMGGNLFTNIKTDGSQELKILYQNNTKDPYKTLKRVYKYQADIAAVLTKEKGNIKMQPLTKAHFNTSDGGAVLTTYKFSRSGEVLLSENSRAAFVDIKTRNKEIVFISLDFSKISHQEQKIALHNLAEFINMQDVAVIVIGHFGQESWSSDFLDFLEETKLEVKNKILLSDGKQYFNPFKMPAINVLAYKDFGIKGIRFLPAAKKDTHALLVSINY